MGNNLFEGYWVWKSISSIIINTLQDHCSLLGCQESILIRERRNEKKGQNSQEQGDDSLHDLHIHVRRVNLKIQIASTHEDPSPALQASTTFHKAEHIGKDAAETTGSNW